MLSRIILSGLLVGTSLAASIAEGSQDCSKSEVPHSDVCLKQWWWAAGCTSDYAVSESDWANQDDLVAIKKAMEQSYKAASAQNATEEAISKCKPLPKALKTGQDCYAALENDCTNCYLATGPLGKIANKTCIANCVTESENLGKKCPSVLQTITCENTLTDACGSCVKRGMFDIPMVNSDCFLSCYKKNNQTIREACHLPEPMKKLVACHDALADVCDECVGKGHRINGTCMQKCWKNEKNALAKCPKLNGSVKDFIINFENKVQSFLSGLLTGSLNNDVTTVSSLIQGNDNGESISDIIENTLEGGQGSGNTPIIINSVAEALSSLFNKLTAADHSEAPIPTESAEPEVVSGDNPLVAFLQQLLNSQAQVPEPSSTAAPKPSSTAAPKPTIEPSDIAASILGMLNQLQTASGQQQPVEDPNDDNNSNYSDQGIMEFLQNLFGNNGRLPAD